MLQKKGKYWYVVINYKDGEKWKKKWIATGSESKREAKRQEKEIEYKAASGMTIYRPKKISPPSDNSWKMALHYHQTARQKAGHIRELQKGVGSSNLSWVTSLKASTDHGAGFFRDGENKQKAMCKKWQPYSSRSPSFLRKEVPRRGGGWLPQRIEKEWEEAVPPFVIHHGKIQMLDTPHMVYHRPANVFVAKCIGSPSMMAKQTSIWTITMERQIFGRSCIGQGNILRMQTSLSSMNRMKS